MNDGASLPAELDDVAVRAWPAAETVASGAWLLRATGGYTDRANSVAVLGETTGLDLAAEISSAERFYAERSLATKFQLSDVDSTRALRAEVEGQGYAAEKSTWVRVAKIQSLVEAGPKRRIELATTPSDPWFDLWWSIDGRGDEHRSGARRLLHRVPDTTAFAAVVEDDTVLAVALGVVDSGWLGLFCAATRPEARGRRLAGSITSALGAWGAEQGARRAYCQVGAGNDASLQLTHRAGFTNAYAYRYFVQPTAH